MQNGGETHTNPRQAKLQVIVTTIASWSPLCDILYFCQHLTFSVAFWEKVPGTRGLFRHGIQWHERKSIRYNKYNLDYSSGKCSTYQSSMSQPTASSSLFQRQWAILRSVCGFRFSPATSDLINPRDHRRMKEEDSAHGCGNIWTDHSSRRLDSIEYTSQDMAFLNISYVEEEVFWVHNQVEQIWCKRGRLWC